MNGLDDSIRQFRRIEAGRLRIEREESAPFAAVDPAGLEVEIAAGAAVRLVIVHRETANAPVNIRIRLQEKARLTLTEVFLAPATVEMNLKQAAHSASRITTLQLAGRRRACCTDCFWPEATNIVPCGCIRPTTWPIAGANPWSRGLQAVRRRDISKDWSAWRPMHSAPMRSSRAATCC